MRLRFSHRGIKESDESFGFGVTVRNRFQSCVHTGCTLFTHVYLNTPSLFVQVYANIYIVVYLHRHCLCVCVCVCERQVLQLVASPRWPRTLTVRPAAPCALPLTGSLRVETAAQPHNADPAPVYRPYTGDKPAAQLSFPFLSSFLF